MKKVFLSCLIALSIAGFSFAQTSGIGAADTDCYCCGNSSGCAYPDCPMGNGYKGHNKKGMHGRAFAGGEPVVTTLEQAKTVVKEEIKNLKGYSIVSGEAFKVHKGEAYRVYVKDGMGNNFFYFVNPWGFAAGPIQVTSK